MANMTGFLGPWTREEERYPWDERPDFGSAEPFSPDSQFTLPTLETPDIPEPSPLEILDSPDITPQPMAPAGPTPAFPGHAGAAYEEMIRNGPPPLPKPKWWQRALAGGVGAAAGFVNADPRGRPIPQETIQGATEGILHGGYRDRLRDYYDRVKIAEQAAQYQRDSERFTREGKQAEARLAAEQARALSEKSQQAYYDSQRERLSKGQYINLGNGIAVHSITGERAPGSTAPDTPETRLDTYRKFKSAQGQPSNPEEESFYALHGNLKGYRPAKPTTPVKPQIITATPDRDVMSIENGKLTTLRQGTPKPTPPRSTASDTNRKEAAVTDAWVQKFLSSAPKTETPKGPQTDYGAALALVDSFEDPSLDDAQRTKIRRALLALQRGDLSQRPGKTSKLDALFGDAPTTAPPVGGQATPPPPSGNQPPPEAIAAAKKAAASEQKDKYINIGGKSWRVSPNGAVTPQ